MSILAKMRCIKQENECCCCFSKEDLFSMLEPHNFEGKIEIYSTMIAECFQIELKSFIEECNKNFYLICKNCIFRLRDANTLRSQVQLAYDRLQAESCKKDGVVSSEYLDFVETKEGILKSDISECDNANDNAGADSNSDLSHENEYKLDPLIVELEKNAKKKKAIATRKSCENLKNTNDIVKSVHFCNICNKSFTSLQSQRRHMILHTDKRVYCDHCGKSCARKYDLVQHIMNIHMRYKIGKLIVCKLCGRSYQRKNYLLLHMKKVHMKKIDGEKFICDHCGESCPTRKDLMIHSRSHVVSEFTCDICEKIFKHKSALAKHIILHKADSNIKCDICKRDFVSVSSLERHFQIKHQTRECDYCNKSFSDRQGLRLHIKTHLKRTTFDCEICGKKLTHKNTLYNHLLRHSNVKSQECGVCGEAFFTEIMLKKHMKIHLEPEKITCKYCNKVFLNRSYMLEHEKIHLNVKDFVCDFCNKGFRRKSILEAHILAHLGIRNVKCDQCEKSFTSKNSLRSHKFACHSSGFLCNICGHTSKNNYSLSLHMLVHDKSKGFECKYCGKMLKTKLTVQHHIKNYCKLAYSSEWRNSEHLTSNAQK